MIDYRQARLNTLREELERLQAEARKNETEGREYARNGELDGDKYLEGYGDCMIARAEDTLHAVNDMLSRMAGLWELS